MREQRQRDPHPPCPARPDRCRHQPGTSSLGDGERRRVLEERLREQAVIEAEDRAWRRKQARRDAACAAAQERAERERQAAAAADAVRQALLCEDCGAMVVVAFIEV
ncbi:hypothetical protein [Streptomyces solaniscabiei]|uniref:hypothetical protein n=1 Tax=Streptomyces solaniscabiei TaxID=2683255 RepID=UPI001CE2CFF1|nr:hypothetical protein [Streptomyces solaniscabiei]